MPETYDIRGLCASMSLVNKRNIPPVSVTELELIDTNRSLECTVINHVEIFFFRGANQVLLPIEVPTLTKMKIFKLI